MIEDSFCAQRKNLGFGKTPKQLTLSI